MCITTCGQIKGKSREIIEMYPLKEKKDITERYPGKVMYIIGG